jgi:hypothetical protein
MRGIIAAGLGGGFAPRRSVSNQNLLLWQPQEAGQNAHGLLVIVESR